jgi:hypothetical protein
MTHVPYWFSVTVEEISVVTSHEQVESGVESSHPKVESFHYLVQSSQCLSVESSQWLQELYDKQKGEQKCLPYKLKHAYICIENYFLFLQALSRTLANLFTYKILDEFILNKL